MFLLDNQQTALCEVNCAVLFVKEFKEILTIFMVTPSAALPLSYSAWHRRRRCDELVLRPQRINH